MARLASILKMACENERHQYGNDPYRTGIDMAEPTLPFHMRT